MSYDSEECDPYDDMDPQEDAFHNGNNQDTDDDTHHHQKKSFPPTKKHTMSQKNEPPIMNLVFSQSEKYLRNITDNGEKSELDNVIQRLAMVRRKAPVKMKASADKFHLALSGAPPVPPLLPATSSSKK